LQSTYRHQIVTGQQVQDYISREAGIDLSRVFAQYLTTTDIPVLEWRRVPEGVRYRWSGVLPGFDMPVDVAVGVGQVVRLRPTTAWQGQALPAEASFVVDEDFYVTSRDLQGVSPAVTSPPRPSSGSRDSAGRRGLPGVATTIS